jgi:Response regulator containing CheY-like receiver, AAA-type ATPase, and DNA-binding domains
LKTILLIDDDADDRESFCSALNEVAPEYQCVATSSCAKALIALGNKDNGIPEVIFVDINMPVMSGWQCLSKLKTHPLISSIPVIIYSTSSYLEDIKKAKNLGAFCFFSKPDSYRLLKINLDIMIQHLCNNSLYSINESSAFILC